MTYYMELEAFIVLQFLIMDVAYTLRSQLIENVGLSYGGVIL